jgi:hypothetical protein
MRMRFLEEVTADRSSFDVVTPVCPTSEIDQPATGTAERPIGVFFPCRRGSADRTGESSFGLTSGHVGVQDIRTGVAVQPF